MSSSRPILGLKIEGSDDDDDLDFFSDIDSGDEKLNLFSAKESNSFSFSFQNIGEISKLNKFEDLFRYITALLTNLKDYKIPQQYEGPIHLIPADVAPTSLEMALQNYYDNKMDTALLDFLNNFDESQLPDEHLIQVQLIRHKVQPNFSLKLLADTNCDSRIVSLVFWLIAEEEKDPIQKTNYALTSALFFLRQPTVLPISAFFPTYKLSNILSCFAHLLIQLFPANPLVPSVLSQLKQYTNEDYESMLPIRDDDTSDITDSDDFEDLKTIKSTPTAPLLNLFRTDFTDALDFNNMTAPTATMTSPDPPSTLTFFLLDNAEKLNPPDFIRWLTGAQDECVTSTPKRLTLPASDSKELTGPQSMPINRPHFIQEISSDFNIDTIYQQIVNDDQNIVLPDIVSPNQYALVLPVMHYLNIKSEKPFLHSFLAPKIIRLEFLANRALIRKDNHAFEETIHSLLTMIPQDLSRLPIQQLEHKRQIAYSEGDLNDESIAIMALTDLELLLSGRSPITLLFVNQLDPRHPGDHPALDEKWRREALFALYCRDFPPYISFRASFALAVSITTSPSLSSRLLFEGIYQFTLAFPVMKKSIWCMSAFIEFGEYLEAAGKYSYCCNSIDNSLSLIVTDPSLTSRISNTALHHGDYVRAVFYAQESLRLYNERSKVDEALYTAQVLAKIYAENELYMSGITLLNSLLMNTYQFSIRSERAEDINTLKPMPNSKKKRNIFDLPEQLVNPQADSINTVIAASTLVQFLLKMNQFSDAEKLIDSISSKVGSVDSVQQLISFFRGKIYYSKGNIKMMLKAFQNIPIHLHRRSSSKFANFSFLSFDSSIAMLKITSKAFIERNNAREAIFWSEMVSQLSFMGMNDSGIGFLRRAEGLSLLDGKKVVCKLDDFGNAVGKFVKEEIEDPFGEMLGSLEAARYCFDRVGNSPKHTETTLMFCEKVLEYFLSKKTFTNETNLKLNIVKPSYVSKINCISRVDMMELPPELEHSITPSNVESILSPMIKSADTLSRSMMYPLTIIRVQTVKAMLLSLVDQIEKSKIVFGFAFQNLQKFFFVGTTCAIRDLPLRNLAHLRKTTELLLLLLFSYRENRTLVKHISLIDMYNDLDGLVRNMRRTEAAEPTLKKQSQFKLRQSLLHLKNLEYPDFEPVLIKNNYLKMNRVSSTSSRIPLMTIIRKMKSTTRHFSMGLINEKKMREKNTQLCEQIVQQMNERRQQKPSLYTPPDSALKQFIFIEKVANYIVILDGSDFSTKVISLDQATNHFDATMYNGFCHFSGQSVLPNEIINGISECIQTDIYSHGPLNSMSSLAKQAKVAGEKWFGKNRGTFIDRPDSNSMNSKMFGPGMKGQLLTLVISPLVIVATPSLQFLPFEFMFDGCVIRSAGFFKSQSLKPQNVTFSMERRLKMKNEARIRSIEALQTSLATFDSMTEPLHFVDGRNLTKAVPSPLFNPKKETVYYEKKYPFCNFHSNATIRIMTYTDLAEWGDAVADLPSNAMALFIPGRAMKDAFKLISAILERHSRREKFFLGKVDDEEKTINLKVLSSPLQFLGTLQLTLMKNLEVPIGIIAPHHELE